MFPTTIIPDPMDGRLYDGIGLPMWTVYDRPKDFPTEIVARLFDGMTATYTPYVFVAKCFEDVRKVMPHGMVWIVRDPKDEPPIMGTFL